MRAGRIALVAVVALLGACGIMPRGETPADLAHPQEYSRPKCSFKYPGNWTLAKDDPNFNADSNIILVSPNKNSMIITVGEPQAGVETAVRFALAQFSKSVTNFEKTADVPQWGSYKGFGLSGHGLNATFPTRIRYFASGDGVFTVMETSGDNEGSQAAAKPGFDLVESSFVLKR